MAIPKYYTEAQDAKWREWSGGNVDGRGLKKRDPAAVTINGVTVHALAFDTGEEWDCVNGWRAEVTPEPTPEPHDSDKAGIAFPPDASADKRPFYEETKTDSGLVVVTEGERMKELRERAQAYAIRVWSGQSDSVGRNERIRRVKAALEGQSLPTDDVRFPGDANDDDWTDEDSAPVSWKTQLPKPEGIV